MPLHSCPCLGAFVRGRSLVVMSEGGQRADMANDLLHLGVEGGEVGKLEASSGSKLAAKLLVGLLPRKTDTHRRLYDVRCGLWAWEWPERSARLPQLQHHHHK
eukprot:3276143-Pyramimonas_sp.AAC.1